MLDQVQTVLTVIQNQDPDFIEKVCDNFRRA